MNRQPKAKSERPGLVEVPCAFCGAMIYKFRSQLKIVKAPTCSRSCNGKLRSIELVKHSHKGRSGWSPETVAKWRETMKGEKNPSWTGGSYVEPEKGYRMIRMPEHPRARANGYVLEHLLVAEKMLGRPLLDGEEVHHEDRDKLNNSPENLKVYASHKEHWVTEHLADVHAARDAAASKASGATTEP